MEQSKKAGTIQYQPNVEPPTHSHVCVDPWSPPSCLEKASQSPTAHQTQARHELYRGLYPAAELLQPAKPPLRSLSLTKSLLRQSFPHFQPWFSSRSRLPNI